MNTAMLDACKSKNSNILDIKIKNYPDCGYCSDEDNKIVLDVPWELYSKWLYLSHKMEGKEWGGVFTVKENTIIDFKIPKQEVSGGEVEFKEDLGGNGIVHSHHNMGAFHSHQDDKHARNLFEYSIVLSNGKGYTASKRVKLPCGGFGYVNVELNLINKPDIDLSKIKEKKVYKYESYDYWQPGLPGVDNSRKPIPTDPDIDDLPCVKCTTYNCDECNITVPESQEYRCFYCDNLRCNSCKHNIDNPPLPFCEFCEGEFCDSCEKLEKYLDNYPEEREKFGFIQAGQSLI